MRQTSSERFALLANVKTTIVVVVTIGIGVRLVFRTDPQAELMNLRRPIQACLEEITLTPV